MAKLVHHIMSGIEMDEELRENIERFRERELTNMETDLKIQADRVLYVINRCLAKLNVAAHLPFMMQNDAQLLRKYFAAKESYFILELLNNYGENFNTSMYNEVDLLDYTMVIENVNTNVQTSRANINQSMSHTKVTSNNFPNPLINQMVDLLFYNKCLVSNIRTAEKPTVDRSIMNLIKLLYDYKDIARRKLYGTGEEEEAMDRELRSAYKANVLLTITINDLEEQLEKQRKELEEQLAQKVEVFDKYNKKMEAIKEEFQIKMRKNLHDSERIMMHKSLESEQTQAELAEEAKRIVDQFETLLEEHLASEKLSRAKRFKIETQLQNWLTKYDQDIGEKQTEYEILKKEYDEKKAAMDELEELIDNQEEEYITLMEEKEAEEERIYNEIAYQILTNRSARIIQKFWRAYRERKAARKRARKGKGKGGKHGKRTRKPVKNDKGAGRETDLNAALKSDKKIKQHVFEEVKDSKSEAFKKKEVVVEL